jgi:hypothetical protein
VHDELCPADLQTFTELGQAADNELFRTVLFNSNILHGLMPEKYNVFHYHNLRPRLHDRFLPLHRTDQLINRKFINRVLMYTFIDSLAFCPCVLSHGCFINEYSRQTEAVRFE